ncbi:MAG: MG2 domain-containing protein [Pirellulales bacterium]
MTKIPKGPLMQYVASTCWISFRELAAGFLACFFISGGLAANQDSTGDELERAITSSIEGRNWDAALTQIKQLREATLSDHDKDLLRRSNDVVRTQIIKRATPILEQQRVFLAELQQKVASIAPASFAKELSHHRIVVNYELIAMLDKTVADDLWTEPGWWSIVGDYQEIDWFWENVESSKGFYSEIGQNWRDRMCVPLSFEGKPNLFDVPVKYSESLGCGEKLLFLATEIEQLDPTPEKHNAGRILLYRARLARGLFGPWRDPEWEEITYSLERRPSFIPKEEVKGLKPVNQLLDNETRIHVGQLGVTVLTLPSHHSPLDLYRFIAQQYPNCDSVPRAMYEIAQYYQGRRQFAIAKREYQNIIERFPNHQRADLAKQQIKLLSKPSILLGRTGVYLPNSQPTVWYTYRNCSAIEFSLRKIDISMFLTKQTSKGGSYWSRTPSLESFRDAIDDRKLQKTIGEVVTTWRVDLPESSMESATRSVALPPTELGEYVLEARIPGTGQISRSLVLVTSVAVVYEPNDDEPKFRIVDADSGAPLSGEMLRVIQYDEKEKKPISKEYRSDDKGQVSFAATRESDALIFVATQDRGKAFLSKSNLPTHETEDEEANDSIVASYAVTDRPAYRPGESVKFRAWYRQQQGDIKLASPKAGSSLNVTIVGPGGVWKSLDLVSDDNGSVEGSVDLNNEMRLGLYEFHVRTTAAARTEPTQYWMNSLKPAGTFRVEEYKRPEFRATVTPVAQPLPVQPSANQSTTTKEIAFQVEANYYFGDPVSNALVDYKLRQKSSKTEFNSPQPFDWLYGAGYSRYNYLYPWLGDKLDLPPQPQDYYRWSNPDPRGEIVKAGSAKLDAKGKLLLKFDTAQFKTLAGDTTEFTLAVDIRDDSRRSISAEGTSIVSRKPFMTFVELDRGWYEPNEKVQLRVITLDPNLQAIKADIVVELSSVGGVSSAEATPKLTQISRQSTSTSSSGDVVVQLSNLPPGQYRAIVRADGSGDFDAAVNFVVFDESLNSSTQRYGDLELIPRYPTYELGQTAQILANVNQPPIQLLLENSLGEQLSINLTKQSSIIEIPISSKHAPSTLYRATAIRGAKFLREKIKLYVPPVDRLLNVAVQAEATEFRPGAEASVKVAVTDNKGNPVKGDLVLAAYDASVSAIQPEVGIGPKQMLLEELPSDWYEDQDTTSLGKHQFDASGVFLCPEYSFSGEMFYGPWTSHESKKKLDPDRITDHRGFGMGGAGSEVGDFSPTTERGAVNTRAGNGASKEQDENSAQRQLVQPVVRQNFSATAAWLPHLQLNDQGIGEAKFALPESLTSWKLRAYSVTSKTQVGDGSGMLTTSKPLMVRLQTPKFLIDQDRAVISANVHNNLKQEKEVRVELIVSDRLLKADELESGIQVIPIEDGLTKLVSRSRIASGESQRFDWKLKAVQPGTVSLVVKAMTDQSSDAMTSDLPIVPFVETVNESQFLSLKADDTSQSELAFEIPQNTAPGSLNVRLSAIASPAQALFDTIPFLVGYPYGCVEQTMSRFYPLAIAIDVMRRLDISPQQLQQRTQMESVGERIPKLSPNINLFSSESMRVLAENGLTRLYKFQHTDGGWGWWENDATDQFMTAYVLVGLNEAEKAGIKVHSDVVDRGLRYLASCIDDKPQAREFDGQKLAYMTFALSLKWKVTDDDDDDDDADSDQGSRAQIERSLSRALGRLLAQRAKLNHYGRCLWILALHNAGKLNEAQVELQKLLQNVSNDYETAQLITEEREWWMWQNSDVETNAWLLRALMAIDPDNVLTDKVMLGLVKKRKAGGIWRSTRDSALAVLALSEYFIKNKLGNGLIEFEYALDDGPTTKIKAPNLPIQSDSHVKLNASQLASGKHVIKISKPDGNPLHVSLNVEYPQSVDTIPAKSKGISIERSYRRIAPNGDLHPKPSEDPSNGTYKVGDIIEVELRIHNKDALEYVAFEDPKPAGLEPLQLRSGEGMADGTWRNIELRDQKTIFYASWLSPGEHVLKYKLRAETPGTFRALPALGFAMYAPEIFGSTTEKSITVHAK